MNSVFDAASMSSTRLPCVALNLANSASTWPMFCNATRAAHRFAHAILTVFVFWQSVFSLIICFRVLCKRSCSSENLTSATLFSVTHSYGTTIKPLYWVLLRSPCITHTSSSFTDMIGCEMAGKNEKCAHYSN